MVNLEKKLRGSLTKFSLGTFLAIRKATAYGVDLEVPLQTVLARLINHNLQPRGPPWLAFLLSHGII